MACDEASIYLRERKIIELFQSLTVALVYHRPDNPLLFVRQCLRKISDSGSNDVLWDTFLPEDIGRGGTLAPVAAVGKFHQRGQAAGLNQASSENQRGQAADLNPASSGNQRGQTADLNPASSGNQRGQTTDLNPASSGNQRDQTTDLNPDSSENQRCQTADLNPASSGNQRCQTADLNPASSGNRVTDTESTSAQWKENSGLTQTNHGHVGGFDEKAKEEVDAPTRTENLNQHDIGEQPFNSIPDSVQTSSQKHGKLVRSDDGDEEEDADAAYNHLLSEQPELEEILGDPSAVDIILGCMENLPSLPSNTIRIFLSSTFSDFKAERNILPLKAYPELQQFCGANGMDFQVVDMRWGVTDELMNDHQVSDLCIREIATCQNLSCGPNFVAFLGNRYGHRPFPSVINAKLFELFLKLGEEMETSETDLLCEWFKKDENADPPQYLLQPIASKLTYYHDSSPENRAENERDKALWNKQSDTIQGILRQLVKKALALGELSEEEASEYFISVTEQEIQKGVMKSSNPEIKSIAMRRRLLELEQDTTNPKAVKFIDLNPDGSVDEEAKHLLSQLTENKMSSKIPNDEMPIFDITWKGKALEESDDSEHLEYLERFSQEFVSVMKEKIGVCQMLDTSLNKNSKMGQVYFEVLHHAKFGEEKSKLFCGQDEAVRRMREYLGNENEGKTPFIVHGKSGYGKTSLMAFVAKHVVRWVTGKSVMILRHLGTSPLSSNILTVLQSIHQQITLAFKIPPPKNPMGDKIGDWKRYIWQLLEMVGDKFTGCKLVIILDSVDQLSEIYGAHQMHWMPRSLPANVYVIVSALSEKYGCVDNALERIRSKDNSFELTPMSTKIGELIVDQYLKNAHRKLTPEQRSLVQEAFNQCPQPLLLKLALDKASSWSSYTLTDSIIMPSNVHQAIVHLFEGLESKYGVVFVTHSLGYLTCSKGGLTGLEMEDVLSCDDEVLNEVYKYHDPPVSGIVRIPSLMWARLQDELKQYLVERQVDGKTVMGWYHRQFWEAAENRYLADTKTTEEFHSNLAEIFSQNRGIKRTIVLNQRKGKVIENADRNIAYQPLVSKNLRKLSCLPYHLLKAGKSNRLKESCLFNFSWLRTKLEGVGIGEILREYEAINETQEFRGDKTLNIMIDFLEICCSALRMDCNLLAFHVVDRLRPLCRIDKLVAALVLDAEKWMGETHTPLMLPTHPLDLVGLDSPLKFSINVGHQGLLSRDENKYVCVWSSANYDNHQIRVLDLKGKDIAASTRIRKISPLCITYDSKYVGFIEGLYVKLIETETGDLHRRWLYCKTDYDAITPRAIAVSNDGSYMAFASRLGRPSGVEDETKWRTSVIIGLIELGKPDKDPVTVTMTSKKAVDTLMFSADDSMLLATSREVLYVFSVPNMEELKKEKNLPPLYASSSLHHLPNLTTLVIGCVVKKGCRVCVFNYSNMEWKLSDVVCSAEKEKGDEVETFGVHSKNNLSQIIFGTTTTRKRQGSAIWLWDTSQCSDLKKIPIGVDEKKPATNLLVNDTWEFVIVGWASGDMTIVHVPSEIECYKVPQAHSHSVLSLHFLENSEKLLSTAFDNTVKVWKTEVMFGEARQKLRDIQSEAAHMEETVRSAVLNSAYNCVDVEVVEGYAVTVGRSNTDGPQLWKLENGHLESDLTAIHQKTFELSMEENVKPSGIRAHSTITLMGDLMFYLQMTRSSLAVYATIDIQDPSVIVHKFIKTLFFSLIIPDKDTLSKARILCVRDGTLEVCDTTMDVIQSIEIPKITDDISNIWSNTSLKKLVNFKIGSTIDGRFFVIINPSVPKSQGGKYIDIVDLQSGKYMERVRMKWLPWKVLSDGFYFFALLKGEHTPGIYSPSYMQNLLSSQKCDYRCVIQSTAQCLSQDKTIGYEIVRNSVRVWRVHPLKKLFSLHGHTSEINSGHISQDNKYLVTGSSDNSVRVWSLSNGQQICMFHVFGMVCKVMFDHSASYVITQSFSAAEQRKAAVFKLLNVPK